MTILFEIPLIAQSSDQILDITINEVPYTIRVLWNERFQYFALSISEKGGEQILDNVKMIPYFPLVGAYRLLPFKGDIYFIHKGGKQYRPTYDDIGVNAYGLFYFDSETPTVYQSPLTVPHIESYWDLGDSIWDGGATIWDGV